MLSLQELKEHLTSLINKIEIHDTRLFDFTADYSKVQLSLNKADAYNPINYSYVLPYQQSNLPKGTTAKINQYITSYVCHMTLAKDFFGSIYFPVQDDLSKLRSSMEKIESTMHERVRATESRNKYLGTSSSCEVENAVLSEINNIKKAYEQLKIDFADLSLWILKFLYKDFEQSKKEQESKTYFSRIHMRLAPNGENDDLAQFSNIYKQLLQKYLIDEASAAPDANNKLLMRNITDLVNDDVELLLHDIALAMDKINFDKENAPPSQQVSGLVVNLSYRNTL